MSKILLVDDEGSIRRTLTEILQTEKYQVDTASNGKECLAAIEKCNYNVILLDIKMPKPDGIEILELLKAKSYDTPIIMMSAFIDRDMGIAVMRNGAFDVLPKPIDLNRLLITIRNAVDKSKMVYQRPKGIPISKPNPKPTSHMIGTSAKMQKLKTQIQKVGSYDFRVMITGPNGAGKELVARNLHLNSRRADGPFVAVNCAAIPKELLESELFGYEKNAFTGALKQFKGKFEQAKGGTLFLDEIGDMSPDGQAKILRVLGENIITRVGSDKEIKVDCRVIAATNQDLNQMILDATFREDLYYRLAQFNLKVPALNDRREDIPALVNYFINSICTEYKIPTRTVDPQAMVALQERNYNGNIRELMNIIYQLIVFGGIEIGLDDVLGIP